MSFWDFLSPQRGNGLGRIERLLSPDDQEGEVTKENHQETPRSSPRPEIRQHYFEFTFSLQTRSSRQGGFQSQMCHFIRDLRLFANAVNEERSPLKSHFVKIWHLFSINQAPKTILDARERDSSGIADSMQGRVSSNKDQYFTLFPVSTILAVWLVSLNFKLQFEQ